MKIAVIFDTPNIGWEDPDFKDEVAEEVPEAEYEVAEALMAKGHEVFMIGIHDDVQHLLDRLQAFRPDLVFNCCESFMEDARYDFAVTALLDMCGYRYTGSPPEAMVLARDKATSKKILDYHSVTVPRFLVYPLGVATKPPPDLEFPLIVKPVREDASVGIAHSSVVSDPQGLAERVEFVHRTLDQPAIAEELIEGRELYVGLIGNGEPEVLPIIEMTFDNIPDPERKIATYKTKWDREYRERWGIKNIFARRIANSALEEIQTNCRTAFRALKLRDYGRVDIRLTPDQKVYVLEINPNPFISFGEDMANAAERMGLEYYDFIERIAQEAVARHESRKP